MIKHFCEITFNPNNELPNFRLIEKAAEAVPDSIVIHSLDLTRFVRRLPGDYTHIPVGRMIRLNSHVEHEDLEPYIQRLVYYLENQSEMPQHLVSTSEGRVVVVFDSIWKAMQAQKLFGDFRMISAFIGGNLDEGDLQILHQNHAQLTDEPCEYHLVLGSGCKHGTLIEVLGANITSYNPIKDFGSEQTSVKEFLQRKLFPLVDQILGKSSFLDEILQKEDSSTSLVPATDDKELLACLISNPESCRAVRWKVICQGGGSLDRVRDELRLLCESQMNRLHPLDRVMWWKYAIRQIYYLNEPKFVPKAISTIL
jgi:hypothetical protein